MVRFLLLVCLVVLLAACQPASDSETGTLNVAVILTLPPTLEDPGQLAVPLATPDLTRLPLLAAHTSRVQQALQQPVPILPLSEGLNDEQLEAQALALNDPRFQTYTRDQQTRAPMRNEIFGVYPLRASDITPATESCSTHTCYRVEMYNYALNLYLAAVADLQTETVINVVGYNNSQPDIPPSLTAIALEIARHAPEVVQTLGYTPENSDALMANTRTALNHTFCERSAHLCVAPTFVVGEYALWAIVDLTDGVLVGARWTKVGSAMTVTEKELQDETIMRKYCRQDIPLEQDGWRLNYTLTSSDGLRISEVSFQGKPLLESVKLVDWHVNYSSSDGFGYSDTVGCPVFSQAAVIAIQPPVVEDIRVNGEVVGFALVQEFWSKLWPRPCNYYYEQRYEFYQDGRFRPIVANVGRGCGNDGTYRPVTRIALASPDSTFSQWQGSEWQVWQHEDWRLAADVPANLEGYAFRVGNYYVVPSTGQFGDGGRGDDAYIYVTLHHANRDEGDSDMPTIGPCCNKDHQQGPERFINSTPEPITASPLVIWYVAQMHNDDTPGSEYCWAKSVLENGVYVPQKYPCPSGPLFVPVDAVTDTP